MKKILAIFIVVCCSFGSASAQDVFLKKDMVVNLGVGIGSYFGGSGYKLVCPPISGSFEIGVADNMINGRASIGVGGYLGFASERFTYSTGDQYIWNYYILGARGHFHYQFVDRLDTYGGLMLGYNIASGRFKSGSGVTPGSAGGFLTGIYVGARYYFTDNIAAFTEIGYGVAPVQLGVAFRF